MGTKNLGAVKGDWIDFLTDKRSSFVRRVGFRCILEFVLVPVFLMGMHTVIKTVSLGMKYGKRLGLRSALAYALAHPIRLRTGRLITPHRSSVGHTTWRTWQRWVPWSQNIDRVE